MTLLGFLLLEAGHLLLHANSLYLRVIRILGQRKVGKKYLLGIKVPLILQFGSFPTLRDYRFYSVTLIKASTQVAFSWELQFTSLLVASLSCYRQWAYNWSVVNAVWNFKVLVILNIYFESNIVIITEDEVYYSVRSTLLKVEVNRNKNKPKTESYLHRVGTSQSLVSYEFPSLGGVFSLVSFGYIGNYHFIHLLL